MDSDDEFPDDEFPGLEIEEEPSDDVLKPGVLASFHRTLTPEQLLLWHPIRRRWKAEVRQARAASGKSNRDTLYDAMNQAQGKITAEKIERLIDKAVEKGDPNALRIMAQMAGMDLADRPKQAAGEGAKVVIIRPHPMLLTADEEASVQEQISDQQ